MKKLILIAFVFLIACKETNTPPDVIEGPPTPIEELLKSYNLEIEDWEHIDGLPKIIDSTEFLYLFGTMDTCAWVAKFGIDGGASLFDFKESKNVGGQKVYSRAVLPTNIGDSILFFNVNYTVSKNYDPYATYAQYVDSISSFLIYNDAYPIKLSTTILKDGRQTGRVTRSYIYPNFLIQVIPYNSKWEFVKLYNYSGRIIWERPTTNNESIASDFKYHYGIALALSDSIYVTEKDLLIRLLNLKDRKEKWATDVNKEAFTRRIGIDSYYSKDSIVVQSDTIIIYYSEYVENSDEFSEDQVLLRGHWLVKLSSVDGRIYSDLKLLK